MSISQTIFGIHGRHISARRLTYKNRGTLLMQNNPRLPKGPLFRCSKTTTSESLIGQCVVLNGHVWAEVDRRRGLQRYLAHKEHVWGEVDRRRGPQHDNVLMFIWNPAEMIAEISVKYPRMYALSMRSRS